MEMTPSSEREGYQRSSRHYKICQKFQFCHFQNLESINNSYIKKFNYDTSFLFYLKFRYVLYFHPNLFMFLHILIVRSLLVS